MASVYFDDGVMVCRIDSKQEIVQGTGKCDLVYVSTSIFSYLHIPYFACSGLTDYDNYLNTYQEMLRSSIYWNNLPHTRVTQGSALRIASRVMNVFLHQANANHSCNRLNLTTANRLQIFILSTKPASLFVLLELVRAKGEKEMQYGDRYELNWSLAHHQCSICMVEIEKPWDSLTLPCSHIFHEVCILRWLEKTNDCPLCGLEMATENY